MPGNPLTDPNWATDLSDQIVSTVGKVRDRTAGTAVSIVKGLVFAMLGLFLGVAVIVLGLIFLTRGAQTVLDIFVEWDKAVWISYFLVGGILTLVGLFLLSRRSDA